MHCPHVHHPEADDISAQAVQRKASDLLLAVCGHLSIFIRCILTMSNSRGQHATLPDTVAALSPLMLSNRLYEVARCALVFRREIRAFSMGAIPSI